MQKFDQAHQAIHYPPDRRFRVWIHRRFVLAFAVAVLIPVAMARVQYLSAGLPTETFLPAINLANPPSPHGFPAWLRLTHFVNFFFLLLLVRSGLSILMDHPRLYWNRHCTPNTEWMRFTPLAVPTDHLWTAKDDARYISPLAALPGYRHTVGMARAWHFLSVYGFLLNGFIFVALLFFTDQWRRLVPVSWEIIPASWKSFVYYATFHLPAEPNGFYQFNPLQQLSYFGIVFVMAPLSMLTGIAMSPAVDNRFPFFPRIFGSRQGARSIHFILLMGYRNASFLQLSSRSDASGPEGGEIGGKRGEIGHFTDASRRRMLACLAKIENDQVPFFATCTYPDEFDKFALYREEYKRHLELLCKRIERRFPGSCCLWKLEFMPRKSGVNKGKIAPHYHIFLFGVPWAFEYREMVTDHVRLVEITPGYWDESVYDRGEWVKTCASYVHTAEGMCGQMVFKSGDVANADGIREWMARNWFDIVGTGLIEHFRAGTGVEMLRSKGGAFAYASKLYVAKSEEVVLTGAKPGRFWGVVGRKNLKFGRRDVLELTHEQAVKLRRTMRRYRMAKCPPEKRGKIRKGQLFSDDYTVKLFATVEFWMERLPALLGSAPRLRQAGEKRLFPFLI